MKEGDLIPDIILRSVSADGTKNFGLHENFKLKRALIICAPGAFTSTCHLQHLPPFISGAKRLMSEKVEYEESGWYDGQVWEKPLVLKEKESLIASIEVKPILKNLIQIFSIISVLALSGILLFQYNNF